MSYTEPLWEINGNQAPVSSGTESRVVPRCDSERLVFRRSSPQFREKTNSDRLHILFRYLRGIRYYNYLVTVRSSNAILFLVVVKKLANKNTLLYLRADVSRVQLDML